MEKEYYLYIMTNPHNTVLYTGITNDLKRRVNEHISKNGGAFSQKYHICKLVYAECFNDINEAIFREKQIKGGSRKRKKDLINKQNPEWKEIIFW